MDHKEATTKIYFTKDYNRFRNIRGNRNLNLDHIDKIIRDIENGFDMLRFCPIIVDKDMKIIDGQHRFHVCKELGSPVWYVMSDTITLNEIAKMNSMVEKWKTKDFIHCFVELGNKDYIVLEDFMKKYRFPKTLSISLLQNGKLNEGGNSKLMKDFETGNFRALCHNEACILAEQVVRFKVFEGYKRRNFIMAIDRIIKSGKCDLDELINKFNKNHLPIKEAMSVKEYMAGLETIYNINKQNRLTIF